MYAIKFELDWISTICQNRFKSSQDGNNKEAEKHAL